MTEIDFAMTLFSGLIIGSVVTLVLCVAWAFRAIDSQERTKFPPADIKDAMRGGL